MKHYIFRQKIETESVDELLKFITSVEEPVTILVDTQGGENILTNFLLFHLNLHKERITLISGNELTSNGFWLFYNFEGKKIVTESTFSCIHESWLEIPTYAFKDRKSVHYKNFVELNKINKKQLEILKPFLTKKEIKSFKKGFDVYLNSERLNSIFNK